MVCPQDIVPEFLQSKINRAAMFFLERWSFLLETPPNKLFLFNHFLIVLSLTLIFNMLTDACKVWTVAVGQICTWGQLLGYSLLERLEAVLNVFPQWITFSHCRMIVWKQPYNPSLDGQQQLRLWDNYWCLSCLDPSQIKHVWIAERRCFLSIPIKVYLDFPTVILHFVTFYG